MAMGTAGNEYFSTHLIEEDGKLNGVQFDQFLEKVNLAACGRNYAVVSIMGPQSSGKSTLLNHLFGSNFKELDGFQRRGKTTRGIWLARGADIEPCTLVMDVEGCDGRERGEDDTAFERQSGLFALTVSHIVLINMFYTDVGREQGACKPLLRNVFQGVLQLFKPRKTTLMFVVRDLVQETQLDIFKPILMEDIQKIWDSIPKPGGQTPLSRFFNIEVEGLPNFMERKEQFKEQVKILRQRFNHSIAHGGLAGDRRDTTLGSDFSFSAQEIWKTIKEDGELHLPNHTVMIANTRCGEIAAEMRKAFDENEERRKLEKDALTNPARIRDFGKKYSSIIKSYMDKYNKKTEYYDEGVRSEKREHLKEKMMLLVQSALQRILAQIRSRTLEEFKEEYQNALKKGKDATVTADNCKKNCMKSFDHRCADVIVEQANCNTSEERKKLELEIDKLVLQVKLEQGKKVSDAITHCEAIAKEKLKAFANKERHLTESAKINPAQGFGKEYSKIFESCLDGYDRETENYDEVVRSEKREHLKEKMMPLVQSALQCILAQIGSRTLEEFKETLHNALEKSIDAKAAADNYKKAYMKSFDDRCADVIVEQANCNTREERKELELAIDNVVLQVDCTVQHKKANEKAVAAGVGGAVMATAAIGGGVVLGTFVLPATVVATAATGVVAGATALGTLVGKSVKAYKSKNRKFSQAELEAIEHE